MGIYIPGVYTENHRAYPSLSPCPGEDLVVVVVGVSWEGLKRGCSVMLVNSFVDSDKKHLPICQLKLTFDIEHFITLLLHPLTT
jgi:hypothetical protein